MTAAEPTERELQALAAYAATGDYEQAARRLGMTAGQLRGILFRWRQRESVASTVVLVWRYRDRMAA